MEILTIVILITFQTTYKTVLKKALKIFWEKMKVFTAFVYSKASNQPKG